MSTEDQRRELLEGLRDRHVEFLKLRMVSARAEEEWRSTLVDAASELLQLPFGRFVSPEALERLLRGVVSAEAMRATHLPVAKQHVEFALPRLKSDDRPLGTFVPADTRKKIVALLQRPGLIPEKLIREALEQDAVEEIMRDVLFDALMEFSQKVNPFIAEWGLPALLKRLPPFGLGAFAKSIESMRADFDKRLEPEIRKFLQGFARRALRNAAEFSTQKRDQPKFVELRQHMVEWVLSQPISLVALRDDETNAIVQDIAFDIAAHEETLNEIRTQAMARFKELVAAYSNVPLGEVMKAHGIASIPAADLASIAAALWPSVRAVLEGPAAHALVVKWVTEFYDQELMKK